MRYLYYITVVLVFNFVFSIIYCAKIILKRYVFKAPLNHLNLCLAGTLQSWAFHILGAARESYNLNNSVFFLYLQLIKEAMSSKKGTSPATSRRRSTIKSASSNKSVKSRGKTGESPRTTSKSPGRRGSKSPSHRSKSPKSPGEWRRVYTGFK